MSLSLVCLWMSLAGQTATWGQRQKWHDEGFAVRRLVELSASGDAVPEIVVCEFFSHGAVDPGQPELAVFGHRDRVASQMLQVGPGDFCRAAFQTTREQVRYALYYGGRSASDAKPPAWTAQAGLYFETRRWKPCDLNRLDSVQKAFAESPRLGSDFVAQVFHRHNPFDVEPGPFLSRYVGEIHVPSTGNCQFFTSSQDCSFLLIDGKVVVAAPGAHGPEGVARIKGEATLTEGPHRFEYVHAAQGPESCMVAAWKLPGVENPSPISPEVFRVGKVAHLASGEPEHKNDGPIPDFRLAVLGDIPSPEGRDAMVRVQFANASSRLVAAAAKYRWDFGDGQTSDEASPAHVYLHSGQYSVGLRITRGAKTHESVNRVYVTRHFVIDPKQHQQEEKLSSYLDALEQYDAASLDAVGLVKLIRVYLEAGQKKKAAEAARTAFAAGAASHTDESRWAIATMIGPVLRIDLDDPRGAGEIWYSASRLIQRGEWRVACAVEAADILLNDMLLSAKAKQVLDSAADKLAGATPQIRSQYYRVLGDCQARRGEADASQLAYRKAQTARELTYSAAERDAWRGAHSRSTEAYLRSEEFDRARNELDCWQRDFPADKCEGYLSLLQTRYWMARKRPEQAAAVAGDLLAVAPHSPYADALLFLTAQCEEQLGRKERAAAAYQSLIADYPGSPLVEKARAEVQRLKAGQPPPSKGKEVSKTRPKAERKNTEPGGKNE